MSETTARMVLLGLAAVGGAFWVFTATWFMGVVRAARAAESDPEGGFNDPEADWNGPGRPGSIEMNGRPEDLAAKLAGELARHGLAGAPVTVLGVDRGRVRFEVVGFAAPGSGRGSCSTKSRKRGEVNFRRGKGETSVAEIQLDGSASRGLLVAGGVVLVLGLVGLIAGFVGLNTYVAGSPKPGVRAQVIQMVQCVHLLWPPWLFGTIYRRMNDALVESLGARVANLPFV